MIHFRNNKTEKEVHRKMSLTWDQKLSLVQEKWSQDMIHFCHDHDQLTMTQENVFYLGSKTWSCQEQATVSPRRTSQ